MAIELFGAANNADTLGSTAILFLILIFGIPTYFLPTIIALIRRHRNTLGLFLLNLFLGWSLLGWVGALGWEPYKPMS